MLLFVVIPVAWLGVCALVVGLCRMAARGDTMPAPQAPAEQAHLQTHPTPVTHPTQTPPRRRRGTLSRRRSAARGARTRSLG